MKKLILGIALALLSSTAGAQNVYMHVFQGKEYSSPVRSLVFSKDNLVSLEECLARKKELERTGIDSRYIVSNTRVECSPVLPR